MKWLIQIFILSSTLIIGSTSILRAQDSSYTAVVKSGASIKSKPDIFGNIIKRLDKGDSVIVISKVDKYYLKVAYNDTTGYLNKGYILYRPKRSGSRSTNSHKSRVIPFKSRNVPFITTVTGGTIYSKPAFLSDAIEKLNRGDTLKVVSIVNDIYVKVKCEDITGYFYKVFLSGYNPVANIKISPCKTVSKTTTHGVYGTGKSIIKKCGSTYITKLYINGKLVSTTKSY